MTTDKQLQLTDNQIKEWNLLKGTLSTDELLTAANEIGHVSYDRDQIIRNDCIKLCYENMTMMNQLQIRRFAYMCATEGHWEKVLLLWDFFIEAFDEVDPEIIWNFFKEITRRGESVEEVKKERRAMYEECIDKLNKNLPEDPGILYDIVWHDALSNYNIPVNKVKKLYKEYYVKISKNSKALTSFILNVGPDRLREVEVLESVILSILWSDLILEKLKYLELGLKCEASYSLALDVFRHTAPEAGEYFKYNQFLSHLRDVKEEDKKRIIAVTPPSYLRAAYLFESFHKSFYPDEVKV